MTIRKAANGHVVDTHYEAPQKEGQPVFTAGENEQHVFADTDDLVAHVRKHVGDAEAKKVKSRKDFVSAHAGKKMSAKMRKEEQAEGEM